MFLSKYKKIIVYQCKPKFSLIKVGCKVMIVTRTCFHDEEINLSQTCANRKDIGLYITITHQYLQTIKVLQCCRHFLKQCVVGTCIYQIRLKEAISIIFNCNY